MYNGISYGQYFDTPQCRISLDNVRLKFSYKYRHYDFEKRKTDTSIDLLSQRLDRLFFDDCDINWSYCDFFKIGNYTRTCNITGIDPFTGDWSCAVMIGRYCADSSCKQVAPEAVFDFNPNKVPADKIHAVVGRLSVAAVKIDIQRYDVAFDIPIARDYITLIPNDRQSYKLFKDPIKGVTEYQGARSQHNAMKLYDKTKESDLPVPVTRCEITVGGDYSGSIQQLFPGLVVLGDLQVNMGYADLPFPVVSCLLHPDLIPMLKKSVDHKTWKKYKDMIAANGQCNITPSNWSEIDSRIHSWLFQYKGVCA